MFDLKHKIAIVLEKVPYMLSEKSIRVQYYLLLLWAMGILLLGVAEGPTSISDYFDLIKSKDVLQSTTNKLEREVDGLASEIHKINTSKDYARKVLRDRYHVTDKNERILFFSE